MRIGLDIDNVVSDFDKAIMAEYLIEDKNKRNNGIINNKTNKWIKDMFDWTEEEHDAFFNNNMQRIAKDLELRDGAKYYIDKLLEEGNEIYLISNRVYPHYTDPYNVTIEWLKKRNVNYTKLVLSETTNKSKECLEHNIDIMFDDSIWNVVRLLESGINAYVMKTEYNKNRLEGLNSVNDWKNLYEVIKNEEKNNS